MCQRRGEELNTQHRHILVCKCTSKSAENWGTSWEWPMHAYTHLQLANLQQTRTFKACATWGIENCKERRHAMTCSNTKNTWWSRVHYWQPLTHDARHKVTTRSRVMIYPRQITLMEFMTSYFATMYAECRMLNHKKHKMSILNYVTVCTGQRIQAPLVILPDAPTTHIVDTAAWMHSAWQKRPLGIESDGTQQELHKLCPPMIHMISPAQC